VRAQVLCTTAAPADVSEGNVMLTITATRGRHDTSAALFMQATRARIDKRPMHSCRDSFLARWTLRRRPHKRDITHNINFFMNVPVTPDGGLEFVDGISAPGKYVEMRAEMDVVCLISN
jgi:uncharacterized protein YcgI (DUF1989 family)